MDCRWIIGWIISLLCSHTLALSVNVPSSIENFDYDKCKDFQCNDCPMDSFLPADSDLFSSVQVVGSLVEPDENDIVVPLEDIGIGNWKEDEKSSSREIINNHRNKRSSNNNNYINDLVYENCCPICECKKCQRPPNCPNGLVAIEKTIGNGEPGTCCSTYTCTEKPTCDATKEPTIYWKDACTQCNSCSVLCTSECSAESIKSDCLLIVNNTTKRIAHGEQWISDDNCTICTCNGGNADVNCFESFCKQPDETIDIPAQSSSSSSSSTESSTEMDLISESSSTEIENESSTNIVIDDDDGSIEISTSSIIFESSTTSTINNSSATLETSSDLPEFNSTSPTQSPAQLTITNSSIETIEETSTMETTTSSTSFISFSTETNSSSIIPQNSSFYTHTPETTTTTTATTTTMNSSTIDFVSSSSSSSETIESSSELIEVTTNPTIPIQIILSTSAPPHIVVTPESYHKEDGINEDDYHLAGPSEIRSTTTSKSSNYILALYVILPIAILIVLVATIAAVVLTIKRRNRKVSQTLYSSVPDSDTNLSETTTNTTLLAI